MVGELRGLPGAVVTSPEMGSWGKTAFKPSAISQHGNYVRYSSGCRCDPCKAAWAAYQRERVQKRRADRDFLVAAMDPAKHGTKAGYRVGCRCEPCKAAEATRGRELYQRNKAARPS